MKIRSSWGLLLIPIFSAMVIGWTPSLYPIYTDEDIVFDPALLGTWLDDNGGGMEITASTEVANAYIITPWSPSTGNINGSILAHLVKIADYMFLDLYPAKSESDPADIRSTLLLSTHIFVLIDQIEPELIIRDWNSEWLKEYLEANPGALGFDHVPGVYSSCSTEVLTASTEDIQAFMVEHIDTEGAYLDLMVYHRAETR